MVDGVMSVKGSPFLGGFGWLLVIGLAMLAIASGLGFANAIGGMRGDDVGFALLRGFGSLAVAAALCGAGLFSRELAISIRTALIIAGTYFLVVAVL
ncbi:MAG TPA: hypothetical protein VJ874_06160 [Candidatus Thermoplasmatota archaeon]|nr:hypothetical protein [Candidatus Thermoplasmatota archaeon]